MNKERRKQLDALRQCIENLKSEAESLKDDLERQLKPKILKDADP
ncbi:hypothetical protein [Achromobacter sp. SLBN-14]|nr:hypothetical protein [Achromobacter sp. SLBN-14]